MPKIPQNVLRCVFYLYESEEDAKAGKDPGGTGFFVAAYEHGFEHIYAVTNWHVAVDDSKPEAGPPCPVIKFMSAAEQSVVIPLRTTDWFHWPGEGDIAITPIHEHAHVVTSISTTLFLSESHAHINVGEDVFMLGLFANHSGGETVIPAARFGNISVMPSPSNPIQESNTASGSAEGFVLDMHSRDGFSGSPVFVFRTFGSDLSFRPDDHFEIVEDRSLRGPEMRLEVRARIVFNFLGMHHSQFTEDYDIKVKAESRRRRKLIRMPEYIEGLSGMTIAIPAWRILRLLEKEELAELRAREASEQTERSRGRPRPE